MIQDADDTARAVHTLTTEPTEEATRFYEHMRALEMTNQITDPNIRLVFKYILSKIPH